MFDIAWSELFLTAVVALVVIGPKDLPKAMLMLGRAVRAARQAAHGWRQQFDQLTYEVELAAQEAEQKKQPKATPAEPPQPTAGDAP